VAIVANLINPEVVILGGYYIALQPWVLPWAEEELVRRSIASDAGGCRLVASTLGYGAAALGAAARVLDSVDSGRLPAPISTPLTAEPRSLGRFPGASP
jgi:hypothetical protein